MTLRADVRIKVTCPKHRGYNPATQGEAGIRGGCVFCTALLDLQRAADVLKARVGAVADSFRLEARAGR